MKNFKKTLVLVFFITICKVHGLYQGNPASCDFPTQGFVIPEESNVSAKIGYQAEYVFDRKMELINQRLDYPFLLDQATFLFNQAALTLNIVDRLEAFATLGTMRLSLKRKEESELHSNNGFTWSFGGRALLVFWEETSLGVAASYLVSYPSPQQTLLKDFNLSYNEWQIELVISQRINPVSLYLGGAYSYAQLGITHHEVYKNRYKLSMITGLSVFTKKGFTMNIEAKFFGETSLGGSLDFRF